MIRTKHTQDSDPRQPDGGQARQPHPVTHDAEGDYPDNPVLVRVWRGAAVESVHRGAWVLTDGAGTVLDGAGSWDAEFYARSSVKALQALPLIESGAADRFGFAEQDLALAASSHNAEPCHTTRVQATLARLGLGVDDLRCGPQVPADPDARAEQLRSGRDPSALDNNCSGKHAGFLALARHLGSPTETYLDPASEPQVLVRQAVAEMCGLAPARLGTAIDGCSAPTFRLPLSSLALGFARFATPEGLSTERAQACRRLLDAAARHPVLIAGSHKRIDTDILRASSGRLFPKIGAESVYVIGVRDADRALAVKIDDGGLRGLHAFVAALVARLGLLEGDELAGLGCWTETVDRNRAGLDVGRIEAVLG